ncbi:MAG: type II toxin-antitoxin system HipA family toxin [Epsilonproteobacteria bacterium]|nr:MAG: type II toxin-antitoxin system HipA family toxin [Campylobacterota bacterium]RLA68169.1 MAG: type II toxin-antitoxin system HipA family toxin [Campylobacterota bacterium]
MGRKKKIKVLRVYLNGLLVGNLKKEASGLIAFRYGPEWIEQGFAISLSLPIQEEEFKGEVVSRYFDNLLPDNDEIRKTAAAKFGAESIRPFDLLAAIGRDCVGALSFLPEDIPTPQFFDLKYIKLNEKKIANKIRGLGQVNPLGMEEGDFRISIAGAQEKTALLKMGKTWCEPQGMTPTTHIFKKSIGALNMDIDFTDSIDNEWASLFLMKKFGINTCNAFIEQFEDQRVLVVERFDRKWVQKDGQKILLRVPQEDMCQALGISPYKKYENEGGPGILNISKLLMASKDHDDRKSFFKTIMIFDLLYAPDGHGKNFSIFLGPDGFQLTPVYDVMGGYFLYKRERVPKNKLKLAMKVGASGHYGFERISKRHYEEMAKKCNLNKDVFVEISRELQDSYNSLNIKDAELDSKLNQKTLNIILEGMKKRVSRIL